MKKQDTWISIQEQLPKKQGEYWVTMRHIDGHVSTEKYSWEPGYLCKQA